MILPSAILGVTAGVSGASKVTLASMPGEMPRIEAGVVGVGVGAGVELGVGTGVAVGLGVAVGTGVGVGAGVVVGEGVGVGVVISPPPQASISTSRL